ncbi:MAG: hypothetical protein U9N50_01745 [Pseudomonadota bacterium]|nr:hypothetical protein [Pseudomonadota bacterium]
MMVLHGSIAMGGVLDPDCTAEKAAKSATAKATVGVGGRCSPKETAADSARGTVGIEEKGPTEKHRKDDDDGIAKKAVKGVLKD